MGQEVDLPPVLGGRYRPLRPLGVGGMGAVYVVEHVHTGERLALKVLLTRARASTDALERFKREARALALVRSDHVVRVTDADVAPELENAPFLVMELLEGTDLERATRGAPQSPRVVVEWLHQVGRGLERAHALGITHRDLKPENLFLTKHEDGADLIKILDFGIAKVRAEGAGSRTQTGQIVGTPKFMSPEQARGETDAVGPAADIWALGLIAFRLLVGTDYWTATAVTLLLAQIIYEPLVAPSARGCTLGPAFDAWFLRSCDREPSKRWASVREQVEALAEALGEAHTLPPAAPAVTGPAPAAASDGPSAPAVREPTLEATPAPPTAPTFNSASVSRSADRPAQPRPRRLAAALGFGAAATALVAAGVAIGAKTNTQPAGAAGVALADNALAAAAAAAPSAAPPPAGPTIAPAVEPVDAPPAATPIAPAAASPGSRPAAKPAPAASGKQRPGPKPVASPPAPPPPAGAPPGAPPPRRDPLEDQH